MLFSRLLAILLCIESVLASQASPATSSYVPPGMVVRVRPYLNQLDVAYISAYGYGPIGLNSLLTLPYSYPPGFYAYSYFSGYPSSYQWFGYPYYYQYQYAYNLGWVPPGYAAVDYYYVYYPSIY